MNIHLGRGAIALVFSLFGVTVMSANSSAAQTLITCTGTNVVDFSPGLTFTNQETNISGRGLYASCVAAGAPGLSSGTSVITGSGVLDCLTSNGSTVEVVTWNTGKKSTISYTQGAIVQPAGEAVAVVIGTVVEGAFEGAEVISPGVLATLDPLACAGSGVTEIGGPVNLSFVSLK